DRTRSDAATGKLFFRRTNRREIAACSGSPLEQHAFRLGQFEDRSHRILDRIDEARGALRLHFNTAVEPHWRVERHHLVQQQVHKLIMKDRGVLVAREISALFAPAGNRGRHTAYKLAYAGLTFGSAAFTVEVLGS